MNNETNIYDIDGELIRKAGDNHKMTVEEASDKIEYYRKKLTEVGEDSPKAVYYATYMRNLSQYIMTLYAKMTPKELSERLEQAKKQENLDQQIKDAIEELKKDLPDDEKQPEKETVMDEYVNFEEVNDIEPVEPEVLEP